MLPTAPPVTADGLKAPFTMLKNAVSKNCMFCIITPKQKIIYKTAIKGSSAVVNLVIFLAPPIITSATTNANAKPIKNFINPF